MKTRVITFLVIVVAVGNASLFLCNGCLNTKPIPPASAPAETVTAAPASLPPPSADPLAESFRLYTADDNQGALAKITDAAAKSPDDYRVYLLKGAIDLKLNNVNDALADLNKAAGLNPKNSDIYSDRGFIQYKRKDFKAALADYGRARVYNANNFVAYYNTGLTYYAAGEFTKSLENYKKAIGIKPNPASYDEFVKDVPEKSPKDTANVRDQIIRLFKTSLPQ